MKIHGLAPVFLASIAAALPAPAWAEGFWGSIDPGVTASRRETSTAESTQREETLTALQRYRLNVDRAIFPRLKVGAGTQYEWLRSWIDPEGGASRESTQESWSAFGRLDLGDSALGANAFYSRGERWTGTREGGVSQSSPAIGQETLALALNWRPDALPALELRGGRRADFDSARLAIDRTVYEGSLRLVYRPPNSEFYYDLGYQDAHDEIRDIQTKTTTHALRGTWAEAYLERRVNVFASGEAFRTVEETLAPAGGSIERPQVPAAGLSKVEVFPDVPARITLEANPALVDGNLGAGAGIDIGFGRSAAGDTRVREMGVRFADLDSRVSVVRVWVGERLPPGIAGAFSWFAYQSNDNVDWLPVALTAPVAFDPVQNYFVIRIAPTGARFLKVVTRPLEAGVTSDARYAEVLVTELQFFEEIPVGGGRLHFERDRLRGSASAKVVLVPALNLAYDGFVSAFKASGAPRTRWDVTNGLSLTRKLSSVWLASGRIERGDGNDANGRRTTHRATASLGAVLLPTVELQLSYSGFLEDAPGLRRTQNVALASVRADVYRGVSIAGQGSLAIGSSHPGADTTTATTSLQASLTPHRVLAINMAGTYSSTWRQTEAPGSTLERAARVEVSASLTPFPALYLSATGSREVYGRPRTQASGNVSVAPFRDGALQLRFSYVDAIDTADDRRTRTFGSSLRWKLSRQAWLESGYTRTKTQTPAQGISEHVVLINLHLTLG